jgi:hypothetical protein
MGVSILYVLQQIKRYNYLGENYNFIALHN